MNGAVKGPPTDISPSDMWIALSAIPRPYRVVPMPRNIPGTDTPVGDVAIWPLTQEEHNASNANAELEAKRLFKDTPKTEERGIGYQNMFANEVAVQQLWRACRDANDVTKPAFPSPSMLRHALTSDEVGVLYNHFLTTQVEVGPIVSHMSDDEFEAWVKRIAEGGSAFPFDLLSWDLRTTLVTSMASQLVSYWTATSSAGSQQGEPLSTDSNESSESESASDVVSEG